MISNDERDRVLQMEVYQDLRKVANLSDTPVMDDFPPGDAERVAAYDRLVEMNVDLSRIGLTKVETVGKKKTKKWKLEVDEKNTGDFEKFAKNVREIREYLEKMSEKRPELDAVVKEMGLNDSTIYSTEEKDRHVATRDRDGEKRWGKNESRQVEIEKERALRLQKEMDAEARKQDEGGQLEDNEGVKDHGGDDLGKKEYISDELPTKEISDDKERELSEYYKNGLFEDLDVVYNGAKGDYKKSVSRLKTHGVTRMFTQRVGGVVMMEEGKNMVEVLKRYVIGDGSAKSDMEVVQKYIAKSGIKVKLFGDIPDGVKKNDNQKVENERPEKEWSLREIDDLLLVLDRLSDEKIQSGKRWVVEHEEERGRALSRLRNNEAFKELILEDGTVSEDNAKLIVRAVYMMGDQEAREKESEEWQDLKDRCEKIFGINTDAVVSNFDQELKEYEKEKKEIEQKLIHGQDGYKDQLVLLNEYLKSGTRPKGWRKARRDLEKINLKFDAFERRNDRKRQLGKLERKYTLSWNKEQIKQGVEVIPPHENDNNTLLQKLSTLTTNEEAMAKLEVTVRSYTSETDMERANILLRAIIKYAEDEEVRSVNRREWVGRYEPILRGLGINTRQKVI